MIRKLNFPEFQHKFKNSKNKLYIFDIIRKKHVVLTSEEWVRQNCIKFLIHNYDYPKHLINVEKKINLQGIYKRFDIVIFNKYGDIMVLIECKSPKVKISQKSFDQIAQYNMSLNSLYFMITNGLIHYYYKRDYKLKCYKFMSSLPKFKDLKKS